MWRGRRWWRLLDYVYAVDFKLDIWRGILAADKYLVRMVYIDFPWGNIPTSLISFPSRTRSDCLLKTIVLIAVFRKMDEYSSFCMFLNHVLFVQKNLIIPM